MLKLESVNVKSGSDIACSECSAARAHEATTCLTYACVALSLANFKNNTNQHKHFLKVVKALFGLFPYLCLVVNLYKISSNGKVQIES